MSNQYIGQQGGATPEGGAYPLTIEEQTRFNATHRVIVRASDIPAGIANNTALTLNCFPLGNKQQIEGVCVRLQKEFAIAGTPAYASTGITFGDLETGNKYLTTFEANLNAPPPKYVALGTGSAGVGYYAVADAITVTFAAPGAGLSLSQITQGEISLYFRLIDGNPGQ